MSLYCSLISANYEEIDCSNASELFKEFECACLSPDELQYLKDRINQNSDAISRWKIDQFEQTSSIYEDLSTRFSWLQSQIDKNHIRISDTNNRIDKFGFELSSAIKDLALLEKYSKDFLKGIVDKHTSHINDLHKNVSINASDIIKLGIHGDGLSKLIQMMNGNVNNNTAAINKILASLFSQGIFVEGFVDEDDLPDFGVADEGPCPDCANKGDTNIFLGDNYFKGKLELINRDFVIRHPFPKGTKPDKESHLDVIWRDNEGSVTSDNMSSVASMVEPNGDIKTALRSYRNVSGSIEHCDIILTTPQTGESYVELSNLKIGTQYNEYQCGTGWLETWDWIHGHTTLEIDKDSHLHGNLKVDYNVDMNIKGGDTHIYGNTQIDKNLTVNKDVHMNVTGGTTIIEGDTHIHNTFEVDGDSHFHNNVTIDKNTYIYGWVKSEGTVEGNYGSNIKGAGETLIKATGYDCNGQGPFELLDVHNGKTISLTPIYNLQTCYTADLLGGMKFHELNSKPGALAVDGYVNVRDHICIGAGGSKFNENHYAQIVYGSILVHPRGGDNANIGKPRDEFDGGLLLSGCTITASPMSLDGGKVLLGCKEGQNLQKDQSRIDQMVVQYANTRYNGHLSVGAGGFGVEGQATFDGAVVIGGVDYQPCNCGSRAAYVMNLLNDKTEEEHYTLIQGVGESNTINGACSPEINGTDIYEVELELPIEFTEGTWSVQVSYQTDKFDKSKAKELIPLVVQIEPGATKKFKVYGNMLPFVWSAMGNTD